MIEKKQEQFTKYEVARILGARALQLSMDAPVLLKISKEELENINYDVLKIAELEFEGDVLPITVKRPFPEKKEEKIKKISKEEAKKKEEEAKKKAEEDKDILKKEEQEEKVIKEEGEIMEMAIPDDEKEAEVQEMPKEEAI